MAIIENEYFTIQQKTPAFDWHTIHMGFGEKGARTFLRRMADSGYGKRKGVYNEKDMYANHFCDGILIQFRAVED